MRNVLNLPSLLRDHALLHLVQMQDKSDNLLLSYGPHN